MNINNASTTLNALLSALPIFWLIAGLGFFRLAAWKVCLAGLFLSLALAASFHLMPVSLALMAAADGAAFALAPILWVVLAAFFSYNITTRTGAADEIKKLLSGLSDDRRIQALIIAWGFGSFMEGVAGFGTAVAVPAALLISMGFEPFKAAMICLLANTIAVPFGVIGLPVSTLVKVTEMPMAEVTLAIIKQLSHFVVLTPFLIVTTTGGALGALKGVWLPTLAAGVSFGLTQAAVVIFIGPELPAILSSMVSVLSIIICLKLRPPRHLWRFADDEPLRTGQGTPITVNAQLKAWSPYLLLLFMALMSSPLFPKFRAVLDLVSTSITIYDQPGAKPHEVLWLTTPGSLVFLSAIIGGLIQKASPAMMLRLLLTTAKQLKYTALTIISIVAMAKVLGYSGMIMSVATAVAGAAGSFYPLCAPFLGALGTFLTGSDTSSAILFGPLQKAVALRTAVDPAWIVAANSSGACIGKLISPQSMAIAAMAAGLTGREGAMLSAALRYALPLLAAAGLYIWLMA
ncbi:lactate permease [Deltaproteobacteria bacterium Smac51]|nr:lactate permease [Deltaproteobacteria bacterium Smac51]